MTRICNSFSPHAIRLLNLPPRCTIFALCLFLCPHLKVTTLFQIPTYLFSENNIFEAEMRSSQDLVTKQLAVRSAADDQLPPLGPAVWTTGSQSELTPSQSLFTSDEVSFPPVWDFDISPPSSCFVRPLHVHNEVCSEISVPSRPPPCFFLCPLFSTSTYTFH